jgi:predicted permease
MSVELKFAVTIGVIVLATLAGYLARRFGWLPESASRPIMTAITLAGYPILGFLTIWKIHLYPADAWLPTLGFVQAGILALIALMMARAAKLPSLDRGLFSLCCTGGNHGITMAGFVVFLLFGEEGLGHSNVLAMYTFLNLVLVMYPIAKHYTPDAQKRPLLRLLTSSLFDYRSVGLPACAVALVLNLCGIKRPEVISDGNIVEIWVYALIVVAYVSIGLRLHLGDVWRLRRRIAGVLAVRHILAPILGVSLLLLTRLSPWPMEGDIAKIFLIQSSVSVAVMCPIVANMFHIRPREASLLFVVSSAFYLAVLLPLICWIFG